MIYIFLKAFTFLFISSSVFMFTINTLDFLMSKLPAIATTGMYNVLYYYSKCTIMAGQCKEKYIQCRINHPLLNQLHIFLFKKPIGKNGHVTINFPTKDVKCRMNVVHNENTPAINDYELSDIRFISVEFTCGKHSFHISLIDEMFNYYIVGNKFDKDFFIHLVKDKGKIFFIHHVKDGVEVKHLDNNQCSLQIIDHEANIININFSEKGESILLEKNGYKIVENN